MMLGQIQSGLKTIVVIILAAALVVVVPLAALLFLNLLGAGIPYEVKTYMGALGLLVTLKLWLVWVK